MARGRRRFGFIKIYFPKGNLLYNWVKTPLTAVHEERPLPETRIVPERPPLMTSAIRAAADGTRAVAPRVASRRPTKRTTVLNGSDRAEMLPPPVVLLATRRLDDVDRRAGTVGHCSTRSRNCRRRAGRPRSPTCHSRCSGRRCRSTGFDRPMRTPHFDQKVARAVNRALPNGAGVPLHDPVFADAPRPARPFRLDWVSSRPRDDWRSDGQVVPGLH